MNLLHRLKYRFSEPYRIRIGVGLSPIRSKRELKALIEFCKEQLKDTELMKLNPEKREVFEDTVVLYGENYSNLHYFINENIDWYWS